MMIQFKSPREIEKMRKAGRIVAEVLDLISENIKPGVTTKTLDKLAAEYFKSELAHDRPSWVIRAFRRTSASLSTTRLCMASQANVKLVEGQIVSVDVGSLSWMVITVMLPEALRWAK